MKSAVHELVLPGGRIGFVSVLRNSVYLEPRMRCLDGDKDIALWFRHFGGVGDGDGEHFIQVLVWSASSGTWGRAVPRVGPDILWRRSLSEAVVRENLMSPIEVAFLESLLGRDPREYVLATEVMGG